MKIGNKIIVNIQIIVREKRDPEGKLYPTLPDHTRAEAVLAKRHFCNDYEFHQQLQALIREAVKDSDHYQRMIKDGYQPCSKDRATYKTVDLTSIKHPTRYSTLLPVLRHNEYPRPNNYTPDVTDNNAFVLVKVDLHPGERDRKIRTKAAENVKNREDQRQRLQAEKQKEEDKERETAIKRLKDRSQRAGEQFLVLEPAIITAEIEKMRTEQEKEDQECKKHLENRIQQVLQKREEEQKQAHAAWLRKHKETQATNKQHKPDSTSTPTDRSNNADRQPKTIHAFSLYQSHNMAVKNCINAMKTLAVFDSVIPEAELAFKLRLCYQEFLTDSRTPEQHVTRRPQTQYEPRHPTTTTPNRKRSREDEEDKPPKHQNHTQNTPTKRPKPTTDGWNSPAPKDWREANRRHLEEARQKQQRQQQHNDSDWE